MNIFSRSFKQLNLTPGERALMKLIEGWIFTAVGTGGAIAYQSLATGSHDYQNIALVAGGAAALTVFNSFKKYLAAQTDLPLPEKIVAETVVDTAINQVQKIVPPVPTAPAVPQQQFVPPAPMGAINLANTPVPLRHFGDTGIVPTIGQVPRG